MDQDPGVRMAQCHLPPWPQSTLEVLRLLSVQKKAPFVSVKAVWRSRVGTMVWIRLKIPSFEVLTVVLGSTVTPTQLLFTAQ